MSLQFDNQWLRELPGDPETQNHTRQVHGAMWSTVRPTPVSSPSMVAFSPEMAALLEIDDAAMLDASMLQALAGNAVLPGSEPYATLYGGHQFGHWAGQLGDGRAIYLGEVIARQRRWELQLKGAGPTPYSRRADGRAVLRSSVREFLCSEAMHHLGVPTTRALSLVLTGDAVVRDMFYDGHPEKEPGAIVCRVAPSFTRFGHFEIHAARRDAHLLQQLIDFTIRRDFVDVVLPEGRIEKLGEWFSMIAERTAVMIAHWMRVGFVHGVMNTDNMSILGLTIDYGPYGWMEDFDPSWTPNTTDAEGRRYCFGRQPEIARWNLARLASVLMMCANECEPNVARLGELLQSGLMHYDDTFDQMTRQHLQDKFGLAEWREDDASWVNSAYKLMQDAELDMTIFFRRLADITADTAANVAHLYGARYSEEKWQQHLPALHAWLVNYRARIEHEQGDMQMRRQQMQRANPRYVLRNYLAQQAIDRATEGDMTGITELLDVMRNPYDDQPGRESYAARRPEWARHKAGCSMLSCSS